MIKFTPCQLPEHGQGLQITLRNGTTYLMLTICKPSLTFVNYDGFEKFLKQQTIRTKEFSTLKMTMLVEKEQVNLIPTFCKVIADREVHLMEKEPETYWSVVLYKTDMKRHPAPSEAQKITIPSVEYGMEVYDAMTGEAVGYISNLFYYKGHRYYLCQLTHPLKIPKILSNSHGTPIALTLDYGTLIICLSCRDLLDSNKDYSQLIPTDEVTRGYLQKTCYLECNGMYGSGVRIEQRRVMSAKHIIPEYCRAVGQRVSVGVYPWRKVVEGRVAYVDSQRDYVQIQIQQPQPLQPPQPPFTPLQKDHDYSLSKPITALGFGKYNYTLTNFQSLTMLPTLHKGILSKLIHFESLPVFIKTDALLFNGFSGCGVWSEKGLLAMAVFIVVNGRRKMAGHNYSYTVEMLEEGGKEQGKQERDRRTGGFLRRFDEIHMRDEVPLYPKL